LTDEQEQADHDIGRENSEDRPFEVTMAPRRPRSGPDRARAGSPSTPESAPASRFRPTERINKHRSSVMIGDLSALEFGVDGDNRATYEDHSRTYSRIDDIVISAEQIRR